jgi:Holliday junction resolvase
MTESVLQTRIVKYLKDRDCYVIKTRPGLGTPTGCPDIIALCGGLWLAIEVKASSKSKFQPLQKETIKKLDDWSWCKTVYPENWKEIKAELEMMI